MKLPITTWVNSRTSIHLQHRRVYIMCHTAKAIISLSQAFITKASHSALWSTQESPLCIVKRTIVSILHCEAHKSPQVDKDYFLQKYFECFPSIRKLQGAIPHCASSNSSTCHIRTTEEHYQAEWWSKVWAWLHGVDGRTYQVQWTHWPGKQRSVQQESKR